jgi:hypothetical protein
LEIPVYRLGACPDTDPDEAQRECGRREVRELFDRVQEEVVVRRWRGGRRPLEIYFLECLLYPFRAWPILLGISLAWATLTTTFVTLLPEEWDANAVAPRVPFFLFAFLLLGFTSSFLRGVLASASDGESAFVPWPRGDVLQVLWSGVACLVCFLAGPVAALLAAVWFWLNAGDLVFVDGLIIFELGAAAVTYWILALLAVEHRGRLRDASPIGVGRVARHLGWRGWVVVGLATSALLAQVHLILESVEDLHRGPGGWFSLVWWSFACMASLLALLRWFGLSRFRAKQLQRRARETALSDDDKHPASRREGPRTDALDPIPTDTMLVG